jgi:large subunit ribosomal protein L35
MPKMKTNKSAAQRFKKTGTGKYRRRQQLRTKKLVKKSSKRKRKLAQILIVSSADIKRVKKLLKD